MVGPLAGTRGRGGTCVPQAEGAQEAHTVAQSRGQSEGAAERAVAEEELELGGVARPARAPVAQRHGDLVEVGEQRPRRRALFGILLRRHLAPASLPGPRDTVLPNGRCPGPAYARHSGKREPAGGGHPGSNRLSRQLEWAGGGGRSAGLRTQRGPSGRPQAAACAGSSRTPRSCQFLPAAWGTVPAWPRPLAAGTEGVVIPPPARFWPHPGLGPGDSEVSKDTWVGPTV